MSIPGGSDDSRRPDEVVLDQARAVGNLGASKNSRVLGRVSVALVPAAKGRARVTSDSALLKLAEEDDFGSRMLELKGSIPVDIDLEF